MTGLLPLIALAYGPQPTSKLDLYAQRGGEARPLVVFVHGGSWVGGDKKNLEKAPGFIRWFEEQGYAVAAPEFRRPSPPSGLPSPNTVEDSATDIARALGWLDAHRSEYGLSDDGFVLVGFSSGAHLVALLSTDAHYLAAEGLGLDDIAATISLDVHAYDVPLALSLMEGSEIARNRRLIRSLFGDTEAEQRRLSPTTYISDRVPPSLVVSSGDASEPTKKGAIAKTASARYRDRLAEAGVRAEHHHFEDSTHSALVMGFGSPGHGTTSAVADFLEGLAE